MAPSGEMQMKLMKDVYAECNVNPADVSYVEAHATGTQAGDPQELSSIKNVFCENRKDCLLVGSVKSNLGHGEPAAALCSLAKVCVCIKDSPGLFGPSKEQSSSCYERPTVSCR